MNFLSASSCDKQLDVTNERFARNQSPTAFSTAAAAAAAAVRVFQHTVTAPHASLVHQSLR